MNEEERAKLQQAAYDRVMEKAKALQEAMEKLRKAEKDKAREA